MTSPRRFEQDLPALLADLYVGGTPDYRDDLLGQTARTPQRPAWTFPERWLPVDLSARRVPFAPIPWRAIAVATLILVVLAAALFAVGSAQHRVPAPFGPAANGPLLYSDGDDILVRDTLTGQSRVVIGGSSADSAPGTSPDGEWFAWRRLTGSSSEILMAARADGSDAHVVVNGPLIDDWETWSPDSRHLAVINRLNDGQRTLAIISVED